MAVCYIYQDFIAIRAPDSIFTRLKLYNAIACAGESPLNKATIIIAVVGFVNNIIHYQTKLISIVDRDGEVYWYADPHAGPESPAYVRWLYSWKSWRAGYDGAENYILFRNNWCEWWYPQEPMFRCLCWAYPAADGIVATPAWEAYREAADDLRYATVMMDLAREAKASPDVNASYVGRAALAWIAQTDAERADMDYMRLETVRRRLGLMKALGKEELP